MYSLFKIFQPVLGLDFDLFDEQGLPPVYLGHDPVNHDACARDLAFLESLQGPVNSMRAVKRARQRWVEIDDGHGERLARRRRGKLGRGLCVLRNGAGGVGGDGLSLGGQAARCGRRKGGRGRGLLLAVEYIEEAV